MKPFLLQSHFRNNLKKISYFDHKTINFHLRSKQGARIGNSYDSDLFGLILEWVALNHPAQNPIYCVSRFSQEENQPSFRIQTTNVTNKCGCDMTPPAKTQILLVALGSSCLVKSRSSGFPTAVFLKSRIMSKVKRQSVFHRTKLVPPKWWGGCFHMCYIHLGSVREGGKSLQKGTHKLIKEHHQS